MFKNIVKAKEVKKKDTSSVPNIETLIKEKQPEMCVSCTFWTRYRTASYGHCSRFPPTILQSSGQHGYIRTEALTRPCGEYAPKKGDM